MSQPLTYTSILATLVTLGAVACGGSAPPGEFAIADANHNYLIYNTNRGPLKFNAPAGSYTQRWIKPRTGELLESTEPSDANATEFKSPGNGANILWLMHQ